MDINLGMNVDILVSIVNMKLRDSFGSLEDLCAYYDLDQEEVVKKMEEGEYSYDPKTNSFR